MFRRKNNTFQTRFDGIKEHLCLGDLVAWSINNKWTDDYMIFQTFDKKIGLVNLKNGVSYESVFESLEDLETFLRNKKVDNGMIIIIDMYEWSAYTP